MEERLMKKSQADKDEDYIFLRSLLPSIIKLDNIQRLELRIEFLNSVTRRIQISKNLSPPLSVPTASNVSCPPTPSPRAEVSLQHILGIQKHTLHMSLISSSDLLPRLFKVAF
jgi:hypothetical protein